ncbi:S8 family serine peptidase [Sediminitomix flava]|nr:S8 family serine peptidase [Sediminitomix flava]
MGSVWAQEYKNGVKQGVVRVKFKPQIGAMLNSMKVTVSGGQVQTGIQAFDAASTTLSVSSMKRVFPYSAKHDAKHRKHGLHLWYEVTYNSNVSPLQAVTAYAKTNEVAMAEPVLEKYLITGDVSYLESNEIGTLSEDGEPFDDPYLSSQWHYNNTGQVTPSIPEGDVNLYEAWETQAGSSDIIVSIVDGGIDTDHEDLMDNLWVNTLELEGEEGVDDDGNGYVDDIHGYNFVYNSGNVVAHSHGTHVAGTVSAVNNNGIGVAGVAGGTGNGDGVRLISSQIFLESGESNGMGAAIVYGADNGAVISQNSWGYTSPGYYEQSVLDAINYFIAEAGQYEGSPMNGGIVIFASGNSAVDDEMYPGYWPQVYTVSALGPDNKIAFYSNYGSWVDISAPGGDQSYGQSNGVLSTLPNNTYGYIHGTSMACPHVSGIAALAIAEHGGPNFTADELELYLTSSTHDVDQYNPDYAGKLGVGYIDAALTLLKNEGIKPSTIGDLAVTGVAQDFMTISWTVPADEDDGYPSNFQVFYHTSPITDDNLEDAGIISLNNRDEAGTLKELEISGLSSLTTYYVAVRSLDRWANKSDLSNEVSAETNRGPDIEITQTNIYVDVNEESSFLAEGEFEIANLDEGELKWEASLRHRNHTYDYYSTLAYPTASPLAKSSLSIKERGFRNPLARIQQSDMVELHYLDTIQSGNGQLIGSIGEEDLTITNSSAIRFNVTQDNGFNLTHVNMGLGSDPSLGPVILEVYSGASIEDAELLLAQEVNTYLDYVYLYTFALNEQLYFNKGESFWVVFHIPAGNQYPLGISPEVEPSGSDGSYMSFDLGESWEPLADVYRDDRVWATKAFSNNPHLGEYVTLTPASGQVSANSSEMVQFNVDATTLINGTYNANILIESNDDDEKETRIATTVNVKGQKPDLRNIDVVEFGNVFYGEERTLIIPVTNFGYGKFSNATVISNDPQFEVHDLGWAWGIEARDYGYVTVTYKPNGVGSHNTSLDLMDGNGNSHSIPLFGVGTAPTEITVSPAVQTLEPMAIGDQATTTFTITNTGEYPLQYSIPAYTEGDATSSNGDLIHKFGYSYENSTIEGSELVFEWEDISQTGTEITEFFHVTHPDYTYYEVDLGFDFPFYNEVVRTWNLTRFGLMTIDKEGPLGVCLPPSVDISCAPRGVITGLGWELDILGSGGTVHYQKMAGKFIVQYTGNYVVNAWGDHEKITFQMVLFANGDIEYRYLDVEGMYFLDREEAMIGIGDRNYDDKFMINEYEFGSTEMPKLNYNETSFRIKHPGTRIVANVSQPEGLLQVGESRDIEMTIDSKDAIEGEIYQNISILSNDPFNPKTSVKVEVDINSGGVVDIELNTETLDFGQLFQMAEKSMTLTLSNIGTKSAEIISATVGTSSFEIEQATYSTALAAKTSNYITVNINTEEVKTLDDVLTVTTSEGDTYEIQLMAEVLDAPEIVVDITSISETVEAGTKKSVELTIENPGNGVLDIITEGTDWLYEGEAIAEVSSISLPEFAYSFTTSKESNGVKYQWRDITKTGEKIPMEWFYNEEQYWRAIPLPFEVELYQEKTDTLWVSWAGVITTSSPKINPLDIFLPDVIPSVAEPNNIIAPYFGIHFFEVLENTADVSGVFFESFDDHIVISWNEGLDRYGMAGFYSFQAIIYTNGTIKYQYNAPAWARLDLGVIGIENKDGTDGILVAGNQPYLEHELALVFTPGVRQQIPANSSNTITMQMDASSLNAGMYDGVFTIHNNSVASPQLTIPVSLEVTGDPMMTVSEDSIDFGKVMAYMGEDDYGYPMPKTYYHEFEVSNTGHANLQLSSVALKDGSEMMVEMYGLINPVWGTYGWRPIWGWVDIAPGTSQALRVTFQPTGEVEAIADTLVIESSIGEEAYMMPISAMAQKAPIAEFQGDEIDVMANTPEHTETRTVFLSNVNGEGILEYDLSLDFERVSTTTSLTSLVTNEVAFHSAVELQSKASEYIQVFGASEDSEGDYNAVIEYDTASVPDIYMGFGGGQSLVTATRFVAPEEGFTLSHVQTWYQPLDVMSSDIVVYIVAGDNLEDASLLTEQEYNHTISESDSVGSYLTVELNEPQYIYPNEDFYVVFAYPFDAPFPQGSVVNEEASENKFFFYAGEWVDLSSDASLANVGWMVKAMEETAGGGAAWVTIEGEMSGEIAAGDSVEVELSFDASRVRDIDNLANLIAHTNDPITPSVMHSLTMHMNQGPIFMIDAETELSVYENDTLSFEIYTVDMEGDATSFEFAEEYDNVSMSVEGDTITFVYTPDYESAGTHSFVIQGADEYQNASEYVVTAEVMDVNRAPLALTEGYQMALFHKGADTALNFMSLFEDPDGDELTFDYYMLEESDVADVYASNADLLVKPMMVGTAEVMVIATDVLGLSVETKVTIQVTEILSANSLSESVFKLYPVPAKDEITVALENTERGIFTIEIRNTLGEKIKELQVNKANNTLDTIIPISELASGVYIIQLKSEETELSRTFIKQ